MTTMIPTMTDRVAIERRHAEFNRMQNYEYIDCAAVDAIAKRGWKFVSDPTSDWLTAKGWWVNDEHPVCWRPVGDPRRLVWLAYKTAQLYTDISIDELKERADTIRREEWVRNARLAQQ